MHNKKQAAEAAGISASQWLLHSALNKTSVCKCCERDKTFGCDIKMSKMHESILASLYIFDFVKLKKLKCLTEGFLCKGVMFSGQFVELSLSLQKCTGCLCNT